MANKSDHSTKPDREKPDRDPKEPKERPEAKAEGPNLSEERNRRASGEKPDEAGLKQELKDQFIREFVAELDKAKADNHRLTAEDKETIARLAWERTDDSLTCLGWFNLDGLESSRDSGSLAERAGQFIDGLQALWDRYQDMVSANTKGGDRYFHCLGHCESASLGPGGQLASQIVGPGRELLDLPKTTIKNAMKSSMTLQDGWGAAKVDGFADTFINREGLRGGTSGVRCYDHCGRFKPRGM
jgi:Serum amyloid A protein